MPTIIKTGAVAWAGTTENIDENNMQDKNMAEVTTEDSPVRPPAPIPAVLSRYVVTLEHPKSDPVKVPQASANNAFSNLVRFTFFSLLFIRSWAISLSEKMPDCLPVPKNIPIVSKISERLKAKTVIMMIGYLAGSESKEPRPLRPIAAKNVSPNSEND